MLQSAVDDGYEHGLLAELRGIVVGGPVFVGTPVGTPVGIWVGISIRIQIKQAARREFGHLARSQQQNFLAFECAESFLGEFYRSEGNRQSSVADCGLAAHTF